MGNWTGFWGQTLSNQLFPSMSMGNFSKTWGQNVGRIVNPTGGMPFHSTIPRNIEKIRLWVETSNWIN